MGQAFEDSVLKAPDIEKLHFLENRFEKADQIENETKKTFAHDEMNKRELWLNAETIHDYLFQKVRQSHKDFALEMQEKALRDRDEMLQDKFDHLVLPHVQEKSDELFQRSLEKKRQLRGIPNIFVFLK